MQNLKTIIIIFVMLITFTSCEAKIKNAKTETHKVWGNCGMCQETIEKAVLTSCIVLKTTESSFSIANTLSNFPLKNFVAIVSIIEQWREHNTCTD